MRNDFLVADEQYLASDFRDWIKDHHFPCVGAKAAVARDNLSIMVAHDIASGWNDIEIHRKIMAYFAKRPGNDDLRSFAVIFSNSDALTEERFEDLMWQRLQSLADKDSWLGQKYDASVSSDPAQPHFSLSFGGKAYFVVGLHPGASRPARRFVRPALVFNPHDQFQRLREAGSYERMRERILVRDFQLAGSINPMLTKHGESSAAPQYSGREVGAEWVCPFHDSRA